MYRATEFGSIWNCWSIRWSDVNLRGSSDNWCQHGEFYNAKTMLSVRFGRWMWRAQWWKWTESWRAKKHLWTIRRRQVVNYILLGSEFSNNVHKLEHFNYCLFSSPKVFSFITIHSDERAKLQKFMSLNFW